MISQESVLISIDDGIARVTLNRPDRRNAISIATGNALSVIWDQVAGDDTVRVIVLDAVDCGSFCAGMDLKEMAEMRARGDDILSHMRDPFQMRMRSIGKPIIAALVGHAMGAGMLLAMHADIRIGLKGAKASIPEVRHGRGTSWMVPLLWMIPQPILSEMAMTGSPVPLDLLAHHGFINHIEDTTDAVRARAGQIAATIARNAPLSVRAAKASLAAGMDLGCATGLARAEELHRVVYASQDAREGPMAFAEGRQPVWTGT